MAEENTFEESTTPEKPSAGKRTLYFLGMVCFGVIGIFVSLLFLPILYSLFLNGTLLLTHALHGLLSGVAMASSLFLSVSYGRSVFASRHRPGGLGKWRGPLAIITLPASLLIIFVLILPLFSGNKSRANDSLAKSNLFNLYLGCKAYWADNGGDKECVAATVSTEDYGFVQSDRVNIEGHGTESTFTATAQHMDSTTVLTINANGWVGRTDCRLSQEGEFACGK